MPNFDRPILNKFCRVEMKKNHLIPSCVPKKKGKEKHFIEMFLHLLVVMEVVRNKSPVFPEDVTFDAIVETQSSSS